MIKTKKELKDCLKLEKKQYGIRFIDNLASFFGLSERGIIWKYQRRLRKWEYHLNNCHKFSKTIFRLATIKFGRKCGFSISPNCFDIGLKIMHVGSILVNSNTRVGKFCTLHINTAFVATGGTSDSPVCGDNLKVGVGATLVGTIILGNDIAVGAGAVVTKSFNANHLVLGGIPARVISEKGSSAI